MRNRFYTLLISLLTCAGLFPASALADAPVEDGVYYISNLTTEGYLGLGTYHNVDPYIYYVANESEITEDGWWIVTNTRSGYTFRNQATNQLLVFTYERVDKYYKYMKLSDESLGDHSEYWNIIEGSDGAYCIRSALDTDYYWNLRGGTYMMGTYSGSSGNGWNDMYSIRRTTHPTREQTREQTLYLTSQATNTQPLPSPRPCTSISPTAVLKPIR